MSQLIGHNANGHSTALLAHSNSIGTLHSYLFASLENELFHIVLAAIRRVYVRFRFRLGLDRHILEATHSRKEVTQVDLVVLGPERKLLAVWMVLSQRRRQRWRLKQRQAVRTID
jgi:hypothetical protein